MLGQYGTLSTSEGSAFVAKMPQFRLMLLVVLNIWMRISLAGGDLGVITIKNQVTPRTLAGNSMGNPQTGSLIGDLLTMKAVEIQPQTKPPSPKINSRSFRGWLVKQTFSLILMLLVLKVFLTKVTYPLLLVQQRLSNTWIVDSVALDHMIGNRSLLSSFSPCQGPLTVHIADGSCSKVAGIGTINLSKNLLI